MNTALILHHVQTQDLRKEEVPFFHCWNQNRVYFCEKFLWVSFSQLLSASLNRLLKLWAVTQQSLHLAVRHRLNLCHCKLSFCSARQSITESSCRWHIVEPSHTTSKVTPIFWAVVFVPSCIAGRLSTHNNGKPECWTSLLHLILQWHLKHSVLTQRWTLLHLILHWHLKRSVLTQRWADMSFVGHQHVPKV